MKKIVAIIGSANKEGNTFRTVDRFLNCFSNEKYVKEIIFLSDYKIKICLGCNSCFFYGKCSLDEQDDMKIIKRKLEEADILIFATPVYIRNISSLMKVFLDRIAYWTHLMKLKGKIGVVVATTATTGIDEVISYLFHLMSHLGITVVGTVCYYFNYSNYLDKQIKHVYDNILDIETGIIPMYTSNLTESIFLSLKKLYSNIYTTNTTNSEAKYWKMHHFFEYNKLLDIIMNEKKITKKKEDETI